MLVVRALVPEGRSLPSFTFSASAHAVAWNGQPGRRVRPDTFQVDLDDAETLDGAGALMVTHIFGAPCRPGESSRSREAGIPVIFDAAHGSAPSTAGRPLGGFGDADGLSPTKPVVAGEGGVSGDELGRRRRLVRIGRDTATRATTTPLVGLNARCPSCTPVALNRWPSSTSTSNPPEPRRSILRSSPPVPGIRVQRLERDDCSTWKDFTIGVDAETFGITRDGSSRRCGTASTPATTSIPVHRQQSHAVGRAAAPDHGPRRPRW
jgi:hypothetical protein